jgi:hypothetical protein
MHMVSKYHRSLRSAGMLRTVGSWLPMFRDNLSAPSSRVKQCKKHARSTYKRNCIVNGVGSVWFSENVILGSRAWRTRKADGKEEL